MSLILKINLDHVENDRKYCISRALNIGILLKINKNNSDKLKEIIELEYNIAKNQLYKDSDFKYSVCCFNPQVSVELWKYSNDKIEVSKVEILESWASSERFSLANRIIRLIPWLRKNLND